MRWAAAVSLALCALVGAGPTIAAGPDDQVPYDPKRAVWRDAIARSENDAAQCMFSIAKGALIQGKRSRKTITEIEFNICSQGLIGILKLSGISGSKAEMRAYQIADEQLDLATAEGQ